MQRHGINYLEKHEHSFIRFKLIKALGMLMDNNSLFLNSSPPEQHSAWDYHFLCRLHHRLHPLGPAHQGEALLPAEGKWLAEWGLAASALTLPRK